jgi:cell division protein FtsQ
MTGNDRSYRRTDHIRARRTRGAENRAGSFMDSLKRGELSGRASYSSRGSRSAARVRKPAVGAQRRRFASDTLPPVMVRGMGGTLGDAARKRTRPAKRRYDVALGMPGAEVRLPSLPQVKIGWRLLSFVLVGLLGFGVYFLWNAPFFQVAEVKISGLQSVTAVEASAALNVVGEQIFTLNSGELKQKLLTSFPEFEQVTVSVGLPAEVKVSVTERQPVLTWRQGTRTLLVDARGNAYPLRNEALGYPSPVVVSPEVAPAQVAQSINLSGSAKEEQEKQAAQVEATPEPAGTQPLLSVEMVQAVLALAEQAPEGTPLVYDPLRGLGWMDPRGWDVYVGDANDINNKLSVYRAIVSRLQADEVQPLLISVEFAHAPYYRVEE